MYDIYDNPWLLFFISLTVLVIVVMYRRIFPDKCRFWQLIIPFALMAAAFGMDYFVKTDHEKIEITIKQAVTATKNADMVSMAPLISPDYSGNMFISKKDLLESLGRHSKKANILRIKIRQNFIEIDNETATSKMRITVFMQPDSDFAPGNTLLFIELELEFAKRRDNWLVSSMDVISLNDDPLRR